MPNDEAYVPHPEFESDPRYDEWFRAPVQVALDSDPNEAIDEDLVEAFFRREKERPNCAETNLGGWSRLMRSSYT